MHKQKATNNIKTNTDVKYDTDVKPDANVNPDIIKRLSNVHGKQYSMTQKLSITAVMIALVCLASMMIQIPIPLGYAHLGDSIILLATIFFGGTIGGIASAFGSALADILSGHAEWALLTFIIKGAMGLVIALIGRDKMGHFKMFSIRTALASLAGVAVLVVGYVIGGAILYGSLATGLTSAVGLLFEGLVNLIVFYFLGFALEKVMKYI